MARALKLAVGGQEPFASARVAARLGVPLIEELLAERAPRSFIGWSTAVSVLAGAYNETKQHERAEELCQEALALLSPADRMVTGMNLRVEIQLALAEAGQGRFAEASARLEQLLELHRPQQGAVTMGALHRARRWRCWLKTARRWRSTAIRPSAGSGARRTPR